MTSTVRLWEELVQLVSPERNVKVTSTAAACIFSGLLATRKVCYLSFSASCSRHDSTSANKLLTGAMTVLRLFLIETTVAVVYGVAIVTAYCISFSCFPLLLRFCDIAIASGYNLPSPNFTNHSSNNLLVRDKKRGLRG